MTDIIEFVPETTFQEDITTLKDVNTKVFLISGKILQNIQVGKKYKQAGYATFAEAVEVELGLKKSQAYYLIDAAKTYEILSTRVDILPTTEKQLRPISKLLPEQQIEVWQEVAKDKVPTAKEVQDYVNKNYKKDKGNTNNTIKTYTYFVQAPTISIELYTKLQKDRDALYEVVMECVENERKYREEIEALKNPHQLPHESSVEEVILLTRTEMIEIITKYGTGFQPLILNKDKVSNNDLFNTVSAIRNRFEENKTTIPNPLPKRVMLAVGPEPDEDIGTLKSLPRSDIK